MKLMPILGLLVTLFAGAQAFAQEAASGAVAIHVQQ